MRYLVIYAAVAVIIWAAYISLSESVHPLNQFLSTTALTLAVVVQRINGVQKWLSPRDGRKAKVDAIAQQSLITISMNRPVSRELLGLCVHVWEVPLWYRKIFPYSFRAFLKRTLRSSASNAPSRLAIRPTLRRVVALGLVKRPPSGVRFRKFVGLVGVCIAKNDRGKILILDINDPQYRGALVSKDSWQQCGDDMTHRLSFDDAEKLSHSYGQVIGQVVQHPDTGEAIGCVTISIKNSQSQSLNLLSDDTFTDCLENLALGVAPIIA